MRSRGRGFRFRTRPGCRSSPVKLRATRRWVLPPHPNHSRLVAHRIATEWIQRGLFDGGSESVGLVLQPRLVGGSRAADDGVEKPGVEASVLVTGQIDHDRHRPIGAGPRPSPVGSARGAVAALLPLRFPGPPAEPAVRLSPQRALHERLLHLQADGLDGVHGVGMR